VASTAAYDAVTRAVSSLIAKYRILSADGLTLAELASLGADAVADAVTAFEAIGGLTGHEKKQAALGFADVFYDQVIAPIDIPRIPEFVETRVVDPALKQLFLKLAEGLVESLVKLFNQVGWPAPPPGPGPAPAPPAPPLPGVRPPFQPY
jgi:hypothetical protein